MEGINHRTVDVNGIKMHIAEKGEGPVVILLHGFPELWYSWRHQILGLADRGYHAVAPDLRGYGDTDAPPNVDDYSIFHLVGDIVALIDALAQDQEPGFAEEEFARLDSKSLHKRFLTSRFSGPFLLSKGSGSGSIYHQTTLPSWLSDEDINYYASKFEKTGFTNPINYYRNLDKNWELTAPWTGMQIKVPTKFIVGDKDLTYHYPGIQDYIHKGGLKQNVPLLEEVVVMPDVSHWINQEAAPQVTDHIYDFIRKF